MCPCEETGAGLASACWPDQKPVRLLWRDPSQCCRQRSLSPDRHRRCPPSYLSSYSLTARRPPVTASSGCRKPWWLLAFGSHHVPSAIAVRSRSLSEGGAVRCARIAGRGGPLAQGLRVGAQAGDLTPVADAEPSTAFPRNQAAHEHIPDAV